MDSALQGQDILGLLQKLPRPWRHECQPVQHALAVHRALASNDCLPYHKLLQAANWQQQSLMQLRLRQVGVTGNQQVTWGMELIVPLSKGSLLLSNFSAVLWHSLSTIRHDLYYLSQQHTCEQMAARVRTIGLHIYCMCLGSCPFT